MFWPSLGLLFVSKVVELLTIIVLAYLCILSKIGNSIGPRKNTTTQTNTIKAPLKRHRKRMGKKPKWITFIAQVILFVCIALLLSEIYGECQTLTLVFVPQFILQTEKEAFRLVCLSCDMPKLFKGEFMMLVHHINSCNKTKLLQSF